ncbi:hypothetical protein [Actimicrobium sp. GrIS 1.19]|uniref:hypothetical protein n=1 Tax=Actimicrobium sp. GrIS 1.19 TaxID=3071708 RepID=UPI002E10139B
MRHLIALGLAGSLLGCRPATPPADPLATQRAALEKARGVEGQLQQQTQQRMKSVDEGQ